MKKLISVIPVHMFATLLAACGSTTSATSVSILQGLPRIRPNTTATPGA